MINFRLNNSVFVLVMTVCSRFLVLVVLVGIVAFERVYSFEIGGRDLSSSLRDRN